MNRMLFIDSPRNSDSKCGKEEYDKVKWYYKSSAIVKSSEPITLVVI